MYSEYSVKKDRSSLTASQDRPEMKFFRDYDSAVVVNEKVTTVRDMSEVDAKIAELMERREGRFYCQACDYSSGNRGHTREHVERHIEGLSYSCQFCDKTFRLRHSLRNHGYNHHRS